MARTASRSLRAGSALLLALALGCTSSEDVAAPLDDSAPVSDAGTDAEAPPVGAGPDLSEDASVPEPSASVCGDGVVEGDEACDDGNEDAGDGCYSCEYEATAFWLHSVELLSPRPRVSALGCRDATGTINDKMEARLTGDEDGDGYRDGAAVALFSPLDPSAAEGSAAVHFANCSAESAEGSEADVPAACGPSDKIRVDALIVNKSDSCLATDRSTIDAPYQALVPDAVTGPCFESEAVDTDVIVAGITIPLIGVRIAGTYADEAGTRISSGLVSGFLTTENADSLIAPAINVSIVSFPEAPFSKYLPEGTGACGLRGETPGFTKGKGPGGEDGWWMYFSFEADQVAYDEGQTAEPPVEEPPADTDE